MVRRRKDLFSLLLLLNVGSSFAAAFVSSPAAASAFRQRVLTTTPPPTRRLLSTTVKNAEALSFDKVFVAGGSKGVGRLVVDKLLDQGMQVVALVRDDAVAEQLNSLEGVTAITGNAFDQKQVENAMDGCAAAISTLGGSVSDDDGDARVDYVGNNNVIESAGILGVTRVVLVTSIGCGSSRAAAPPSVFEVLKDVLAAKERAENVLINYYTNVNWTIVRPGGLKTAPATGKGILTEDNMAIGSIHREDVAQLVVDALLSPKTERKILSAIDPSTNADSAAGASTEEESTIEAFALA